ncbi:unnamed protein product [Soboliphyme baturini]|uniref:Transmembrane protein 98 n=1 Tax=Soboliphyme baturini TaxID=241478 RepID=A0A183IKQ5_9BILA|nr:unnamed protein product [Soboliphyme baturini]
MLSARLEPESASVTLINWEYGVWAVCHGQKIRSGGITHLYILDEPFEVMFILLKFPSVKSWILHFVLEKILKGNEWVYDAGGLAEHCLAILRGCHAVTDKLSGLSFSLVHGDQELMAEVQQATRRVMPRVDDLIRAMYNSRKTIQAALLEARAAALILAINNLVLAFRAAYPRAIEDVKWLKNTLAGLEYNLTVLREAAHAEESEVDRPNLYSSASHISTVKV